MIEKDKKILNYLLEDSRMELCRISARTKIPISTIFDRIKKMKENSIIRKFTCNLNTDYIRYPLKMFFLVEGQPSEKRINCCYSTENPGIFFIQAFFKDFEDLSLFKKNLKNQKCSIKKEIKIFETLKEQGFRLNI